MTHVNRITDMDAYRDYQPALQWPRCCLLMPVGRIIDFVETGKLVLGAVKYFVLDEADRLLDTGNQDTIMKLFSHFPKAGTGVSRLQACL